MRVRVKTTAAGPWGVLSAGKVGDVPDEIGRAMISVGAAVEVATEPKPVVEVVVEPAPTTTATAEPEQAAVITDPPRRRRKHAQVQES